MSILLESLSQQESSQENSLPDIHSSHFDDDMLGDEWLLKRLKKWQLASIILVTTLIVSWGYFFYYFYSAEKINSQQEIIATQLNQESASTHVAETAIVQTNITQSNAQSNTAKSNIIRTETSQVVALPGEGASLSTNGANQSVSKENIEQNVNITSPQKNIYSPQKKQPTTSSSSTITNRASKNNTSVASNDTQFVSPSKSADDSPILFVGDLSPELQQKFPQISIDSYVVSDSPKDSFVILGGSFYAVNQVIAPKLILRQINQDNIVVEFYSQRVRIPFE